MGKLIEGVNLWLFEHQFNPTAYAWEKKTFLALLVLQAEGVFLN